MKEGDVTVCKQALREYTAAYILNFEFRNEFVSDGLRWVYWISSGL